MIYSSPDEAARHSKSQKAVSYPPKYVETARGRYLMQIAYSPSKGAWPVYMSANGITIHDVQISTKDVDAVKEWKPW
jgi:hypothetical protein